MDFYLVRERVKIYNLKENGYEWSFYEKRVYFFLFVDFGLSRFYICFFLFLFRFSLDDIDID